MYTHGHAQQMTGWAPGLRSSGSRMQRPGAGDPQGSRHALGQLMQPLTQLHHPPHSSCWLGLFDICERLVLRVLGGPGRVT